MKNQAGRTLLFILLAGLLLLGGRYAWLMVVRPRDSLDRAFENPALERNIRRLAERGIIQVRGGRVACDEARMSPALSQALQGFLRQGSVRAVGGRVVIEPHLTRRTANEGGPLAHDLLLPGRLLDRHGTALAWSEVKDGRLRRQYRDGQGALACELDSLLAGQLLAPLDRHAYLARRFRLMLSEGRPARTTIDASLQEAAYRAFKGRAGGAVVLDCRSFEMLAAVSSASASPANSRSSKQAGGVQSQGGLPPDRALNRLYPPGSTFKIIVVSAALEAGLAQPGQPLAAGREYSPAPGCRILEHEAAESRSWPGHNPDGRNSFDITQAFIVSSNVVFSRLGSEQVGWERLESCARRFGYGQPVLLDLGKDVAPWKTATPVLAASRSGAALAAFQQLRRPLALACIGQGENRTSVLEMALVAATIANDGVRRPPRLVPAAAPSESPPPGSSEVQVVSTPVAQRIQGWMREVVDNTSGTANRLWRPDLSLAGKTGTALEDPNAKSHSWFIGFYPASQPRIAFAVLVEHGGFGSEAAGDIAVKIVRAWAATATNPNAASADGLRPKGERR